MHTSPITVFKTNTQIVRERLAAEGFFGLYAPGSCGCRCDDLAPCGESAEDADGWINGCQPGYLQEDPSGRTREWVISKRAAPIDQATFDDIIASA